MEKVMLFINLLCFVTFTINFPMLLGKVCMYLFWYNNQRKAADKARGITRVWVLWWNALLALFSGTWLLVYYIL